MTQGWTVLFFIYAEDEGTKDYVDQMITALSATQHHKDLNVLVFESVCTSDNRIKGALYDMEYNFKTQEREKWPLHDFGEVNPGCKEVLISVLNHLKDNELMREQFLLFTWDHGSGFGIFDADPVGEVMDASRQFAFNTRQSGIAAGEGGKVITNKRTDYEPGRNGRQNRLVVEGDHLTQMAVDQVVPPRKIDMLTFSEINEALKTLNKKTELVIMLNCWMQMLENSYEVRDTVNWLVAAETVHYISGYDYAAIINCMAADPGVSGKEVSRVAIETLPDAFERGEYADKVSEVVVTAVQPGKSEAIVEVLDTISNSLKRKLSTRLGEVILSRELCQDLSYGYFNNDDADSTTDYSAMIYVIDLAYYVAVLVKFGLVADVNLDNLLKAINEYKAFQFIGNEYNKLKQFTGLPGGNGVSVFHPLYQDDFSNMIFYNYFYAGAKKVQLADTQWGSFLKAYKEKIDSLE